MEEAFRCRPERLRIAVAKILLKSDPAKITLEDARASLAAALRTHETAYAALEQNTAAIAKGNPDAPKCVDRLLKECADADRPLKSILHEMTTSALCLSGGGIRSASFGLGLLEGLAKFSTNMGGVSGLLNRLDYLSTVSGGGYIGSWFMAWVYRRWASAGSASCTASYQEVVSALAGQSDVTAGDSEPSGVRHLRSYTSFLAPQLGLTLDTFTLLAILLRNLIVNWAMLVPVLFTVAGLGQCSGYFFASQIHKVLWYRPSDSWHLTQGLVFALAALAASLALPSHHRGDPTASWRKMFAWTFFLLISLGCWLLAVFPLFANSAAGRLASPEWFLNWRIVRNPFFVALVSYGTLAFSIFRSYARHQDATVKQSRQTTECGQPKWVVGIHMVLAAVVMSLITGALLCLVQMGVIPKLVGSGEQWNWLATHVGTEALLATISVPLILAVPLVTTALFCGVLGLYEQEEDREWWMRIGGALLAFGIAFSVMHGLVFFGPPLSHSLWVALCGVVLGFASSWAGYSGATSAGTGTLKTSELSSLGKFLQKHNMLLPTIAGAALLLITLGVVTLAEKLNVALQPIFIADTSASRTGNLHSLDWHPEVAGAIVLTVASAFVMAIANWAININIFSLHGMYRMRLMRAFLGASNVARQPDPFTNFDPHDTPWETDLPTEKSVPLHVICTTLNLVGTHNPAWRQRRAESFTFSPLFAGGWRVGYVEAGQYGGVRGVTLATALSISGAAFNPNMGYQSSPLLSLLMTFFNLRLGFWLPNPKRASSTSFTCKSGPKFALWPLLQEAFGLTDDTNNWIELTDGGHFENLALYEMVMRRCKLIILSDSGADPKCQFEDLGNAIRKIQIDLGVPIVFDDQVHMKAGLHRSNKYCAVARIGYHYVDDPGPGQKTEDLVGYLVYVKPCLNGTEPMDVQQYAKVHDSFPHESTANQFFDEPQFESHRKLAYHEIQTIAQDRAGFTWTDFLSAAHTHAKSE